MRYAMDVTGQAQIAKTKSVMTENSMNGKLRFCDGANMRWVRKSQRQKAH